MFGITATCFWDFNPKNAYPWQDDEAWTQNLGVYLPIHRKCQIWPWFREYNESTEHLERQACALDTLYDVHDRIQPITRPRINSTNKTNQIIANVEILRPNPPIARPETTDWKLSAKLLLSMVLDDGSSLFQRLERYLSHLNQTRLSCALGSSQWFHVGGPSLDGSWRTRISGDGDVAASHTKEVSAGPITAWMAKNAKTKFGWPNAQSRRYLVQHSPVQASEERLSKMHVDVVGKMEK